MALVNVGGKINLADSVANIDNKYGPYTSTQEAWEFLGPDNLDVLAIGLTVGIQATPTSPITEYWFKNACETVEDLIPKITEGSGAGTYSELPDKPSINNVELNGNKSLEDLGIINYDDTELRGLIGDKQETLISGTSIKTINNQTILGEGNIEINIPTKTSDLTNDSNFIEDLNYIHTDNNYSAEEKAKLENLENYDDTEIKADIQTLETNKANKNEIPDVSQFITNEVNNLLNYYLKSETYTQTEVNNLIGQIQTSHFEIVQQLPETGESNIIYLVPKDDGKTGDVYNEYVWINNTWELIGSTQIDLTGYATETWVQNQISNFLTQTQIEALIQNAISGKQDTIDSTHKLSSDFVDDTNETNKFVTSQEKAIWNNKSDFTGDYNDLDNKPNIPTKTSDLTNDSGFITNAYHDASKQDTLVSGLNIKTINGKNMLGAGNIDIQSSNTNPWTNKVISIMGDSISTYNGWIPQENDGHNLSHVYYYPRSTFNDVTKTWWYSLISDLGAKLGVNESWSGSYVGNTSDSEIVSGGNNYGTKCAMASNTRVENLGSNGTPDLILVYGGTNDIWSGNSRMGEVVPGTFDSTIVHELNPTTLLATNKWTSFADAYKDMLLKMMYYYPQSRIVVLFPFYADSTSAYSHAKLDEFIEVQRNICDYFGINYIDLRACGINIGNNAASKNKEGYNTILTQNVHPNYDGMKLMKNYIKARLLSLFETDREPNVTYTVTNNLTTNTNADRYIKKVSAGKSYQATITGSQLGIVKVIMNGIDVTSSVYNTSTGKINISSCTGNIVITEGEVTTYTITANVTNGSHTGSTSIVSGGTATVTISPNEGYKLPTDVTVTGASKSYNSSTGVITLSNPTGNVTISAICTQIVSYDIIANVTNGSSSGDTTISENGTASVTIIPSSGYIAPNSVAVIGASYSYSSSTGIISLNSPTGNVSISAECQEAPVTYNITNNIINGTYDGASTIAKDGTASVMISANEGYKLPDSITVSNATYDYDKTTGTISLSNPTNDVIITAECVQLQSYSITTSITEGTYDGDTSILESGTAEVVLSANSGYSLPNEIQVVGATYTYDKTTGSVQLSEPTGNITITVVCVQSTLTWHSSNYNANILNSTANLNYAGFAYMPGVNDGDGLQMNMVRFVLDTPGKITVGKCSSDFKTIVDSEQITVNGSSGDVIEQQLSKTYTLENGEHFFINTSSGDTGKFKYTNRNAPATEGNRGFKTKVGTAYVGTNATDVTTQQKECLSVDFGYAG